jgi:hypothetical protein
VLWLLTERMPAQLNWVRLVLSIVVGLAAFYFAFKAEHKASKSKIYRHLRHVFRLIAAFVLTVGFMVRGLRDQSVEGILNNAPPPTLFAALVALALMAWLAPKFDRLFFPVRDAYTIKPEEKYAGMSIVEIDDTKHADFRSRLKFGAVWLGGTIALILAIPHGPVGLMAIGWFVVCVIGRKMVRAKNVVAG